MFMCQNGKPLASTCLHCSSPHRGGIRDFDMRRAVHSVSLPSLRAFCHYPLIFVYANRAPLHATNDKPNVSAYACVQQWASEILPYIPVYRECFSTSHVVILIHTAIKLHQPRKTTHITWVQTNTTHNKSEKKSGRSFAARWLGAWGRAKLSEWDRSEWECGTSWGNRMHFSGATMRNTKKTTSRQSVLRDSQGWITWYGSMCHVTVHQIRQAAGMQI